MQVNDRKNPWYLKIQLPNSLSLENSKRKLRNKENHDQNVKQRNKSTTHNQQQFNKQKTMSGKERKFKKRRNPHLSQFKEPSRPDEKDNKHFADAGHHVQKKMDDQPKGLDELVPHTPDKVDLISELAGR